MAIDLNTFDPHVIANDLVGLIIVSPLLQGAQKRVWHVGYNGVDFVLKVYKDEPETRSRAEREVEILRRCNSVHLAAVGPLPLTQKVITPPDDAVLYYLEEYIPGTSLDRALVAAPFSTDELIQLGVSISTAIEVLWTCGFLHRDIKPANIMMRGPGDYVLLDVGLALDYSGLSITRTGYVVGTPAYLSPEQLQISKRGLDFRSDLFGLGIVLYQFATGIHPFWNPTTPMFDVRQNILTVVPRDPRGINLNLPSPMAGIILRLLSKERHLRYGRIDQLQRDLGNAR